MAPPAGPDRVREGQAAQDAVDEARRRTTSRHALARNLRFSALSPSPGTLDQDAFDQMLDADPDAALSLLADLTGATDGALREMARRLAGRIALRLGAAGPASRRGVGRLVRTKWEQGADLDIDGSLDALVAGGVGPGPAAGRSPTAGRRGVSLDDLSATRWARPGLSVCLVVDRSGSMGGARLASAAMAAAALALAAPDDWSAIAVAAEALVLKAQDVARDPTAVIDDLLALRGHGPTDLGLGLRTAASQLARSPGRAGGRRLAVLLTDGRATLGGDPIDDARALVASGAHLAILAPAGDDDDARELAAGAGGRCATIAGPASVPAAVAAVL